MTVRDTKPVASEPEAFAAAQAAVGYVLAREGQEYRWGWVYTPGRGAAETYGPGPVSVKRDGEVIVHGSSLAGASFTDDVEPVSHEATKSWFQRLLERFAR